MKRTLKVTTALAMAGLVVVSCSPLKKMKKNADDMNYAITPEVLVEKGGMVDVQADVTFPAKFFNKKVSLLATPVLKYEGGETTFAPKTLLGEKATGNGEVVPYDRMHTVTYEGQVPYEEAMRISDLAVRIEASKGLKTVRFDDVTVGKGVIATSTLVNDKPMIVIGKDEFQRIVPEQADATLLYLINSAQLRSNQTQSDAAKAAEKFVKDSKADEKVELKGVEIRSYASPDGAYNLNERLANSREKATESYLKSVFGRQKAASDYKAADFVKGTVVVEDWDGFKAALEASNIQDKEMVLRVLANYSDPEVREAEMKKITSAYSTIADQILPQLRRSDFIIHADRIGKSDEEIMDLAKSNPSELNVEELLYAATLFTNNTDKLNIYETAKKQFPNDWRGYNDAGMILFEMNADVKDNFTKANSLSANNPVVLNNLGAVALKNGNINEAEALFNAGGNNYNKAIVAIKKGDYKTAVSYLDKCNCLNAALANILDGNTAAAAKKLEAGKDNSAMASYLKALIGARTDNAAMVVANLKDACAKDASMKKLAATDMEFAKYFDNADFKAIVE